MAGKYRKEKPYVSPEPPVQSEEKKAQTKKRRDDEWEQYIREIYKKGKETGDPQWEENYLVEDAKRKLWNSFGVDDLTQEEEGRLTSIVKRLLPQLREEIKLVEEGRLRGETVFGPSAEPVALWLYELYGIHSENMPHLYEVHDATARETFEYTSREDVLQKEEEVKQKGHKVRTWSFPIYPRDFKQQLERLRVEGPKRW